MLRKIMPVYLEIQILFIFLCQLYQLPTNILNQFYELHLIRKAFSANFISYI